MADGKVEYEVRVDTQGVSKDLDDAEKKIKKASQKGEDSVKKSTNNVEKEIKTLAEGHKTILDRLPIADEQEQLKSRVKVLERVVIDLRSELDELKKAQ